MKSSSQTYLSNLDHLRAFAAFSVFIWHFIHFSPTCPNMLCEDLYKINTPFFSMLEQGYNGVALFMCISGYIFTYLTFGKKLHIVKFWLNRFLRLAPLVIFWGITESLAMIDNLITAEAFTFDDLMRVIKRVLQPQGSWTIYIELQYYLALPIILWGIKKFGPKSLLFILCALIAHRSQHWLSTGNVQSLSYWTIWGRADQFILGSFVFFIEQKLIRSNAKYRGYLLSLGTLGLIITMALYQYVVSIGGLHESGSLNSPNAFWIIAPTLDGIGYSLIIIGYLQLRIPRMLDSALSALGRWSYSIYLNHFQFVPFLYYIANTKLHMTEEFYSRLAVATFIIFPLLLPCCALSYKIIEKPFLSLRRNYLQ